MSSSNGALESSVSQARGASVEMSMAVVIFLLSALPLLALQTDGKQAKSGQGPTSGATVVTVDAPVQELLGGYLRWSQQHPEAIPEARPLIPRPAQGGAQSQPGEGAGTGTEIHVLRMPSVDLYSASGVSLYYGSKSKENAAFIRAFPDSIRQAKADHVRPTFKEAIEMVDELKPYEAALLARKGCTVFAVAFPGFGESEEQDEAVRELKHRADKLGIGVVEVRLHK